MRPGRKEDLPWLVQLWRDEASTGRHDAPPGESRIRSLLRHFEWEARSRVVESDGRLAAAVLLTSRGSPDGVIVTFSLAGEPELCGDLTSWALRLARAGGASIVQAYVPTGRRSLEEFGFHRARRWLRMDLALERMPQVRPLPGYRLKDGTEVPPGEWERMFNRSFADHWRFSPRSEEEIVGGKPPDLCLLAEAEGGAPAAITFGEVEEYPDERRAQPIGLVSSVGTLPEHRRHGLASWLVGEIVRRLSGHGARTASLYVDGDSAVRAPDMYRKLGFEVALESDVWEATVR